MSIENIFNSPATRAKLKDLESRFNRMINLIGDLDLGEPANIFIKVLRGEYVRRRKEIQDANVDEEADITFVPKTRAKKAKITETVADAPEPKVAPEPTKQLTAAEKLKATKAKKEESLTD